MQQSCSWGKGHTFDGFSDVWVRRTERWELLANLWNATALRQLARIFEARLVPLNKAWPEIPCEDQFRPIVVLSPLYKFLERRFQWKLQRYMKDSLDPHQTGFVSGMGTSVNLLLLTERLRNARKRDGECCLFVDYKSAYNTVNRQRLYSIMKRKSIL